jgi:hypothetical protein
MGRQHELDELDDDADTFPGWRPYVRPARLTPITIGLEADALGKLRELVGVGGKFHEKDPDGRGYRGAQTYGLLVRVAVRDFLKKHAPDKTEAKPAKKAAAKTTKRPAKKAAAKKKGARRR